MAAVSWRALCCGDVTCVTEGDSDKPTSLKHLLSPGTHRAAPIFPHGPDARAWHFPLLLGTKPRLTVVSTNPSALLVQS